MDDNIELTHKTRQDGILLQNGLTKDSQLIIVAFNQWSRWSVRLIVLSLRRDGGCKHYFSHIRPIELLWTYFAELRRKHVYTSTQFINHWHGEQYCR